MTAQELAFESMKNAKADGEEFLKNLDKDNQDSGANKILNSEPPMQSDVFDAEKKRAEAIEGMNKPVYLKLPFTVTENAKKFTIPDMRTGGFGYFWSGIILLTLLSLPFIINCINWRSQIWNLFLLKDLFFQDYSMLNYGAFRSVAILIVLSLSLTSQSFSHYLYKAF